jgi:hypothetical protein
MYARIVYTNSYEQSCLQDLFRFLYAATLTYAHSLFIGTRALVLLESRTKSQ